jgi:glycosyltransferase involved in cell wall biosynthesis
MPSLFEPFGIVYAEAAAAGLPIVGTSVGGARDIVAPGAGDLVDPADHRALLAAMDRLTHPDVARESGRVAQTRANLFTWPLVASRLLRALGLLSPMHGAPEFLDATVR